MPTVARLGADARRESKLLESLGEGLREIVTARILEREDIVKRSLEYWWNLGSDVRQIETAPEGTYGPLPMPAYCELVGVDTSEASRSRKFREWLTLDQVRSTKVNWTCLKMIMAIDETQRDQLFERAGRMGLTVRELNDEINAWVPARRASGKKSEPVGIEGHCSRASSHCQEITDICSSMQKKVYGPLSQVEEPTREMMRRISRTRETMEEAYTALASNLKDIKKLEERLNARWEAKHPEGTKEELPANTGRRNRPTK